MPMIDIFTHIFPERYFAEMTRASASLGSLAERFRAIPPLFDLGARFRQMDSAGADYQQIISLPNPPIEDMAEGTVATQLARAGNDAMAELCQKHADRFPGFVAALSLHDVDAAVAEAHRAIRDLGARGVQIFTNVAGRPLDDPRYAPVFATLAEHDLPVWLHPARTAAMTDYAGEPRSRYEMWWCFGWPYETSVAMARLVFAGLFDRHPALKIITHHCGGMTPYYDGRIGAGMAFLGRRDQVEDYSKVLPSLKRPHLDYFHDFYGDTAMFGGRAGLKAGLDFFGVDHIVFATDAPLAPIPETIAAVHELGLSPAAAEQVFSGNARRLLKMS
jgi:aminocarboxymuconate-semialdehyde decarboxylase